MKIYLGCDLFVEGQRKQALEIQRKLERLSPLVEVYNPADNLDINNKEAGFTSGANILLSDYERLSRSDILIALMDTQDLGLAAEMGIAFEKGIPVLQLYTDIRLGGTDKTEKFYEMKKDPFQNDFLYINKLVTGISYVTKFGDKYGKPLIFRNQEELIKAVDERYLNYQPNGCEI